MVTKQDLVEAYSFSRRRLVTAFVSGATGCESSRSARTIVGGLALAGLLLAGAAIARTLSPTVPEDCAHESGVEAAQVTGPGR